MTRHKVSVRHSQIPVPYVRARPQVIAAARPPTCRRAPGAAAEFERASLRTSAPSRLVLIRFVAKM